MTTADVYSLRGVGDMKQPELHKDPEFLDPDKAGIGECFVLVLITNIKFVIITILIILTIIII